MFPQSAHVTLLADVNAQVDLDIAIRHRLADTVQSRIEWALILQESLQKGIHLLLNFSYGSLYTRRNKGFPRLSSQ